MNNPISLCIYVALLGTLICLTTAVSLRHRRNADSEFKWPEPDPNTDHFAHESSCHHYYLVISEDDITINKCPHGELFDYVEHICKDKKLARCWSHHFGRKHHHIALKSSGSFTCPYAWGKYPDINDCAKYYVCLGGKVKHKKCAQFEHFDKISRQCVGTIFGVCADETDVVESKFKCPKNWGSFSFHKDCSKYYECLDREPNLRTCPNNTLFHEKREKCVPKHHVHCKSRYNPYSKNDETSTTVKELNRPSTSSETRKPSVERETVKIRGNQKKSENQRKPEENISPKVKINIEEVQSDNTVSKTLQASKDVFDSTPTEPQKTSVESDLKSDAKVSSEALSAEGGAKVLQTTQAPNDGFDSTPNEPRRTSVERELKPDVKISSEVLSTERGAKVLQTSQVPKDLQTSQTPNELIAGEISNKGSDSTPKATKELDTPPKETASKDTTTLMGLNTLKNNSLNDTDEIPDALNTNEFIEVSTNSETTVSKASQTIAVDFSQKIEGSVTDDKQERITPTESSQVTPSDECDPKDFTCIADEEGNIIRCPEPNGIFLYPGNERRFMLCKEREIHAKFCPGHMIFSPTEKKCISKFIF